MTIAGAAAGLLSGPIFHQQTGPETGPGTGPGTGTGPGRCTTAWVETHVSAGRHRGSDGGPSPVSVSHSEPSQPSHSAVTAETDIRDLREHTRKVRDTLIRRGRCGMGFRITRKEKDNNPHAKGMRASIAKLDRRRDTSLNFMLSNFCYPESIFLRSNEVKLEKHRIFCE